MFTACCSKAKCQWTRAIRGDNSQVRLHVGFFLFFFFQKVTLLWTNMFCKSKQWIIHSEVQRRTKFTWKLHSAFQQRSQTVRTYAKHKVREDRKKKKIMWYLFRRSVRGIQYRSSRTRSGSSPPCRRRCFGTGCSGTVWEAPWSRRVWPPWPSGSLPGVARPCSGRRWTDPGCSPRSRSWATPSTPRWGTPGPSCSPADPRGKGCRPGPGSRSRRAPCRQCAGCWWRWCLQKLIN